MALVLTSPAFADNGAIPKQYTCEGADISPPLNWSKARKAQKLSRSSSTTRCTGSACTKMTWVHWVVHNIPADAESLPEGAAERGMPAGAVQGLNDWRRTGYGGPARRSADIDIFTSSTQSTRYCPVSTIRRKPNS